MAAVGITNQRETTVLWDRRSGAPLYNAIVWQDRRTADRCRELNRANAEAELNRKTGLLLDPYFSATKIAWILDRVPGARDAAKAGHIAFGTIDSFLLWRLSGGRLHATDATNASRTALYDIRKGRWDESLCELFNVPLACLPEVRDSAGDFGLIDGSVLGEALPIRGVAGDQQAALIGQACFAPGDVKSTYGTGAFLVLNTAHRLVSSRNRLLGTIGYQLKGEVTYALEGSILSAGTAIQWLRDGLGIISRASDVEALAGSVRDSGGVYLVPAFTGLGAPHWDPEARGAIIGLTRASSRAEIARAALDSVAYQTHDLLEAMAADGLRPALLKVDGGMAQNGLFMQRLADILARSDSAAEDHRVDGLRRRVPGRTRLRHVRFIARHRRSGEARRALRARGRPRARERDQRLAAGRTAREVAFTAWTSHDSRSATGRSMHWIRTRRKRAPLRPLPRPS